MSISLWPHGLQHAKFPCPSLSSRVCSNSCPLSHWCHPTISSFITTFCSCPQSFPESGTFPLSQHFTSGGQSIGASGSVLPMSMQRWFLLRLTGLISFLSQETLKCLLQHHSLKTSIFWCSAFLMVHLSHLYMITGTTITLIIWTFVSKVISLLF